MTAEELLTFKGQGEASKVQFKERILDKYDIGCELVASSNTHVVGIQRALENDLKISFANNERLHEFLITIPRNGNQVKRDSDTIHDTSKGIPDTFKENPDTIHDTLKGIPDTFEKNPDTIHDTQRIKLTNKQKDIISFCTIPRSSREILERVGVSYHSKNIQTYITSLVNANYLEMTIPDKPFDKNQKYRKKQ